MLSFITSIEFIFIGLEVVIENQKKIYKNLIADWKNQTYKYSLDYYNKQIKANTTINNFLIKCNNDYIIFDTDTEDDYNNLKSVLTKLNLYNEENITISTRGDKHFYKRHFWFKTEDNEFLKMKKHKINNMEIFIGDNCNILERVETNLNSKNIKILTYDNYKSIMVNLVETVEITEFEEIITPVRKMNDDYEYITSHSVVNNDNLELTNILDNLNPKRFDEYNYWITLYFIFVNENFNIELFTKYSKKSKKYNQPSNYMLLKDIEVKEGFTISTLYYWLKEDNYKVFVQMCKNKNIFFELKVLNNWSISNVYFQLNPDNYIYTQSGWYEYNKYNILNSIGEKPPSIYVDFAKRLTKYADDQLQLLNKDDDSYKMNLTKYNKFITKITSTKFIGENFKFLCDFYKKDIQDKINNIDLLAFNNMVYDYRTNEYRKIKKSDYITKTTGYNFDKTLIDNKIKDIINSIIFSLFEDDELVNYWFKITALSLFGNNKQQKFYLLNGKGSNGKSLTQKLITSTLGDYYKSVSNNFLVGSIKKGGADAELSECQGIRYLSISEPDDQEDKKFNISNLKNWSGCDKIQARAPYDKKMIMFYPQFTIFINCNDLPELSNTDDGIKRRLRNIFFPFQFKEESEINKHKSFRKINYNLSDELNKPEFIINFIDMLLKIAFDNKNLLIKTPECVLTASDKYCNENNPIYEWLFDNYEITKNEKDRQSASYLLSEYNCSEYCKKRLSTVHFSKFMEKLNITKIKPQNVSTYINIKILDKGEENL